MGLDAVFFDLDGTLTDSKVGITRSIQYAMTKMGRPAPAAHELYAYIGPPLRGSFAELLESSDHAILEQAVSLYRERFATIGLFENELYPSIPRDSRSHSSNRLPHLCRNVQTRWVCEADCRTLRFVPPARGRVWERARRLSDRQGRVDRSRPHERESAGLPRRDGRRSRARHGRRSKLRRVSARRELRIWDRGRAEKSWSRGHRRQSRLDPTAHSRRGGETLG